MHTGESMTKIIGLLGFINSGKGTVANQLVIEYNFRQDSFASSLKDVCASLFDWPRHLLEGDTEESRVWREQPDEWWANALSIPNFSPRLAFQLIGTNSLRNHFNEDLWFLTLQNRIRKNLTQHMVISDVRFPNEIDFVRKNGGTLIKVNRGSTPIWYETARLANKGNSIAKEAMNKTYSAAHFSEWAWAGCEVDFEVDNNSTVDNLETQVRNIMSKIMD